MARGSIGRRLTFASLILSASVLLSRMLGFVRDAVIAAVFGAGSETDLYFAAFTLPDMMNYFLLGGALSITFIPLYGRYIAEGDEESGHHLVSVVSTTIGSIFIALIVLSEIIAPTLVAPIVPGFSAEQVEQTAFLTRIVMPGQIFFFLGGIISATLLVRERFLPVALAPLAYNLSIIVFGVALNPLIGIAGFSVGALIGAIVGPFLIPYLAARRHLRYRFVFALTDPQLIKYVKLSLPLMVAVSLLTADEWIGRYLGSYLEAGTITWLNNARRLMLVPIALIGQAAGQAALPYLTRLVGESRREELNRTLTGTLRTVIFLSVLAAALLAVLAEPAVRAIYERGLFSTRDTLETAAYLLLFCPAVVAWATQTVAVRAFYAHQDTIRPALVGWVVTLGAIPVYVLLVVEMGGPGLALATSVGLLAHLLATLYVYQRRVGGIELRQLLIGLFRGILVAAVATLPVYWLVRSVGDRIFGLSPAITAWLVVFTGGLVFGAIAYAAIRTLGGPEALVLRKMKLRKKKEEV